MKVEVFKVPQSAPDDLTELVALIEAEKIDPRTIVAILGKTEGNGCVNDFTRGFAVATLKDYLRSQIGEELANRVVFVMSGGTEGVLSPHLTIFTRQLEALAGKPHPGLALGIHHTRDFSVAEIGTLTMVKAVAAGVEAAMADAGLSPADVHFVQIKCPLVSASQAKNFQSAIAHDSYQSMAYSRGASALGVAIALGELNLEQLTDADVCNNYDLYSTVASTSAGSELQNCEILVLGNAPLTYSNYLIGHSVMAHALDTVAVQKAIASAQGLTDPSNIVNVFAKAEAAPDGQILGRRHTMLDDSDINHTRMARAVVAAVVASVVQDPMVYVSGGSEHQGPPGGGPIAVISRLYPE